MEATVSNISVHNKDCYGCKRTGKDVMVTMAEPGETVTNFHDFFLTTEQAIKLRDDLDKTLKTNKKL
jgi:hypothetical protein